MKQKIKLAISIIIMLCLSNHWAFAQFQQILFSANSWRTQAFPLVGRVGIGTFPNGTNLPSALTINTNLIPSPTGEVFRTDCPALNTPFWRMFRGGTEMAKFYSPTSSPTGSTSDFVIETMQNFSNILFKVGYNTNRMIITDGKQLPNNQTGLVGIGPNFYTPQSMLHIHGGGISPLSTYVRITNNGTGQTNGLLLGVEFNGEASIRFLNNHALNILTNDIKRMYIADGGNTANDGYIGIGNNFTLPKSRLHLHQNGNNPIYTQWTNDVTGSATVNDGLRIGITGTGEAELRQQENADMLFYTGDAQSGFLNNIRMIIKGQAGTTNGFVGVGPGFNDPQSLLHLNQSGEDPCYIQWTNGITNNSLTDGFRIGIGISGNNIAELRQQEDAQIDIFTNSGINNTRKMRIWHDLTTNEARVGLGIVNNPRVHLHIGDEINGGTGNAQGYRTWMNKGTLCVESNNGNQADNMYVGMRRVDTDVADAIINWGNNPTTQPAWADRLRFVFTAGTALTCPAAGDDGLEIARMVSDGDNGRTGIGGYPAGFLPDGTTPFPANSYFNNSEDPTNTLEVNSPDPLPTTTVGGRSGLRFTDLTTASTTTPNFGLGVLAVDANGDVIYVPSGGTGTGFGAECDSLTPYDLTSNWRVGLNNNNFYFDGQGIISPTSSNSVGIGHNCGNLSAKLDVLQNSGTPNTTGIFVTNQDVSSGTPSSPIPVIGFKSLLPLNPYQYYQVAGWFEAPEIPGIDGQYAIFVPQYSGHVDIGYLFNNAVPDFLLDVNGSAAKPGSNVWSTPSDLLLKKDISSFTDGLNVIRQIHPINYRYNGLAGIDTSLGLQVGVIANEVQNFAPYTISTFKAKLNEADSNFTDLLSFNSGALIFASFNAINELDSTISAPPAAPVLISPADGALVDGKTATFTWYSVSQGIVLYHAQIAKDNSFSNIVSDYLGITDTTFSAGFCDSIPTTYYWRINAKNNAGTGAWSQVFSFTDTSICKKTPAPPAERDTIIRPISAVAFYSTSDSLLKTNIAPVTNALYKVLQLNGVYYDWLHTNPYYDFDSTRQIGFKAQDVQSVVPEVVHTDTNGFLTLDYGRLVPVLVEAIKDQNDTINNLKTIISSYESRFSTIENMLAQCCEQTKSAQTDVNATIQIPTDATMSKQTQLYQNRPNPFNVTTTFTYTLGEGGNVELIIEDSYGRLITTLVNQKQIPGDYSIDWNAENITSGIYFYSLKVNGILLVKKAIKY